MVEFSVVLVAKQKYDWDGKKINNNEKAVMSNVQEAYKDKKVSSSIEPINHIEEKDNISYIGTSDEYLSPNQALNQLMLSKNMPPYRKTDIIAFILFCCFYLCFNIIYFVFCINY